MGAVNNPVNAMPAACCLPTMVAPLLNPNQLQPLKVRGTPLGPRMTLDVDKPWAGLMVARRATLRARAASQRGMTDDDVDRNIEIEDTAE